MFCQLDLPSEVSIAILRIKEAALSVQRLAANGAQGDTMAAEHFILKVALRTESMEYPPR